MQDGVSTQVAAWAESASLAVVRVPEGASALRVSTSGGYGQIGLYTRALEMPTPSEVDCSSTEEGTSELCEVVDPAAGLHFIAVWGESAFVGVDLVANIEMGSTSEPAPEEPAPRT